MSKTVEYSSEALYIESKCGLKEKIAAIDALIAQMFVSAGRSAGKAAIEEYMLDTGQSKVRTLYRNPESVMAGIAIFEKQREYYISKLNGRGFRLVDGKNFRGRH